MDEAEDSARTTELLLAPGTGRIRLLGAKLAALVMFAVILMAGLALLTAWLVIVLVSAWEPSLRPLASLSADIWRYVQLEFHVAGISVASLAST